MGEKAAAGNKVLRCMELKQKRLPRLESPELIISSWLPKIGLIQAWSVAKKTKPVIVGDSNVDFHELSSYCPLIIQLIPNRFFSRSTVCSHRLAVGLHTEF